MVNEIDAVDNLRLENQLTELTLLVRQLAIDQHQPSIVARVCGICTSMEHPTDRCPITGSSHIKVGSLIINMEGSHFGQGRWLSAAESAIPSTTVPTIVTTKNATSRQLIIFGGPDEVVSNKQSGVPTKHELEQYAVLVEHERHHLRPQGANWAASKHYEPITVGWVRQPTLINNSKSEGECERKKFVPLPFPTRTPLARKPESDEELLKMFWKVEINIPLLDAIKQIPKYTKFLKELCVHKRKKMKGRVKLGGIVSALTRNEEFIVGARQALLKKCRDPEIFSVP
ncbi:hypothetical protein CR513_28930, partial [Mucuna pruriens]